MYGYQILETFEKVRALGLTNSKQEFSIRWCGRGEDLLRDYGRRDGRSARIHPRVVARVRQRLAEAADLLPTEVGVRLRQIDDEIVRDLHIADLLGRRSQACLSR